MSEEEQKQQQASDYAIDQRYTFNKISYLAQVIFVHNSEHAIEGRYHELAERSYRLARAFYVITREMEKDNEADIKAAVEEILGGGRE